MPIVVRTAVAAADCSHSNMLPALSNPRTVLTSALRPALFFLLLLLSNSDSTWLRYLGRYGGQAASCRTERAIAVPFREEQHMTLHVSPLTAAVHFSAPPYVLHALSI
jgi:hypothetical protein